jgi:hypothetical protein
MKNMKKSFLNIMFSMENEAGCVSCQNNEDNQIDPVDFHINLSKFQLFKATTQFNKQSYGKSKKCV